MSSRWISTSLSAAGLRMRGVDRGVRRLDQRRLAHAARAPEQRVVGRQAAREALGVLDQNVAHPVDALEQRHLDAVDARAPARAAAARGCQTKASAAAKSGAAGGGGASRSSASAMRASRAAERRRRHCERSRLRRFDFAMRRLVARAPLAGMACGLASARHRKARRLLARFGRTTRRCNWRAGRYSPRRFRAPRPAGAAGAPPHARGLPC